MSSVYVLRPFQESGPYTISGLSFADEILGYGIALAMGLDEPAEPEQHPPCSRACGSGKAAFCRCNVLENLYCLPERRTAG